MNTPKLYVFAISHFCEKARWALDYLDIPYQLVYLAPGTHMAKVKRLRCPESFVPILETPDQTVQGSKEIIDWAESFVENDTAESKASLSPVQNGEKKPELMEEAATTEARLDRVLGPHLRRYFYSEALVRYPKTVYPYLSMGTERLEKTLFRVTRRMVRKLMIWGMNLGHAQGLASKKKIEQELDWLDNQLSDGRMFLIGDGFSRVDLTAASLLAPLANPENYPIGSSLNHPPEVSRTVEEWRQRPSFRWVKSLYSQYRVIKP